MEKIRQKQGFEQTNLDRIEGEISRFAAELEEILEGMETNLVNITRREEDIRRLQQTIAIP